MSHKSSPFKHSTNISSSTFSPVQTNRNLFTLHSPQLSPIYKTHPQPVMTSPEKPTSPAIIIPPSSPRFPKSVNTLTAGSQRKVAIAVDLSDESAYAVNWAVQNYLRPNDVVILLHVRPTSVLYGADWGDVEPEEETSKSNLKNEDDFDISTNNKARELAKPLIENKYNFKIHIVKDHDMKERLCLEVERLGLSAVIMGSLGFGNRKNRIRRKGLGSVSDYCVHHCVCPVVVVRFPDDDDNSDDVFVGSPFKVCDKNGVGDEVLFPVPEEEPDK